MFESSHPDLLKGMAAQRLANWVEADTYYRKALVVEPQKALYLLAVVAYAQQDYATAYRFLSQLVVQNPTFGIAFLLLGRCCFQQQDFQSALQAYQNYLSFYPEDYRGYLGQAEIWRVLRQTYKHTLCLQQASRFNPTLDAVQIQSQHQTRLQLALNVCFLNQHQQAQDLLEDLLRQNVNRAGFPQTSFDFPQFLWNTHIARLSTMYANPDVSDQVLFACLRSGLKYFPQLEVGLISHQVTTNVRTGPLKIAYLSGEFGHYTSMKLLLPLLQSEQADHLYYAYHDVASHNLEYIAEHVPDSISKRFDCWRSVGHLKHRALAQQIQSDGIHILVDLGGLTHPQRHPMLAYRPAPIQITGPGFLFSAAHPHADFCFSDAVLCPPELADLYPETVLELPSVFHMLQPDALPLFRSPHLENGFITLGSANAPNKLNSRVIELWSQILQALPDSCLFLKNPAFDEPEMQAYFVSLFVSQGVLPERLRFEGACPEGQGQEGHLSYFYRQIDIALDPFPYQGGVNSFEALWMGVPLLVMSRPQWRARALSLSLLTAIGLSDWAVSSEGDYCQRALDWASDSGFLQEQRRVLRNKLLQSNLCDTRHGEKIAQIYESLWQNHSDKHSS